MDKKSSFDIPYLFKIADDQIGQSIFYAGEEHSFDPNHFEWKMIEEFWNDFLETTINSRRVAFVEAGLPPVANSIYEAITKYGGTGLIMYLAKKNNIESINPEPSLKEEIDELLKLFSKEQIEYYYFSRVVNQWFRIKEPRPLFEEYIIPKLKRDQTVSGWEDFDFSIDGMKKIHEQLFDNKFDLKDKSFFKKISDPTNSYCSINRVSRASGIYRDEFIVQKILDFWKKGHSLFIEYGSAHAFKHEAILKKEIFGQK